MKQKCKDLARITYQKITNASALIPVSLPRYSQKNTPLVSSSTFLSEKTPTQYYPPLIVSPGMVMDVAKSNNCIKSVRGIFEKLESDAYLDYIKEYYDTGLSRYGDTWQYADITTVLYAACQLIHPASYLEIGVRTGRSMAIVAATSPNCEILGCDMWIKNYAEMENPGQTFVRNELKKVNYRGNLQFLDGDSHKLLPQYFKSNPDAYFDMITVDGDHSFRGASMDLRNVLPRLKIGGIIIFDDTVQRNMEYLFKVWNRYVASQNMFACAHFGDLGLGISIGMRKY